MNTRKKLIVSLSILSLTIVAAIVSIVGVFALINTSINFGGNITFSATNIYATVSEGIINNGAISNDGKMQAITYDADNDGSATVTTWSNLNLSFPENGDDVVIKFNVTNHSTQDKLRVFIDELEGTCNNATMSVEITNGRPGVRATKLNQSKDGDFAYCGEATALIDEATEGESATEYSAEVVVTFHIIDKNYDASISNFNIPITLEKFDGTYYITVSCLENVPYKNEYSNTVTWEGSVYACLDDDEGNVDSDLYIAGRTTRLSFDADGYAITLVDADGVEITIDLASHVGSEHGIDITKDNNYTITYVEYRARD